MPESDFSFKNGNGTKTEIEWLIKTHNLFHETRN